MLTLSLPIAIRPSIPLSLAVAVSSTIASGAYVVHRWSEENWLYVAAVRTCTALGLLLKRSGAAAHRSQSGARNVKKEANGEKSYSSA